MEAGEDAPGLVSRPLRSRVMVCYALCAVAESEIQDGNPERARKTIETVRKLIAEIAALVSEPSPISSSAIRDAGELLAELESRVASLEAGIGGPAG